MTSFDPIDQSIHSKAYRELSYLTSSSLSLCCEEMEF